MSVTVAVDGPVVGSARSRRGGHSVAAKCMAGAVGTERPVNEAMLAEREIFLDFMATSADVKEGLAAFAEGRPPRFES